MLTPLEVLGRRCQGTSFRQIFESVTHQEREEANGFLPKVGGGLMPEKGQWRGLSGASQQFASCLEGLAIPHCFETDAWVARTACSCPVGRRAIGGRDPRQQADLFDARKRDQAERRWSMPETADASRHASPPARAKAVRSSQGAGSAMRITALSIERTQGGEMSSERPMSFWFGVGSPPEGRAGTIKASSATTP